MDVAAAAVVVANIADTTNAEGELFIKILYVHVIFLINNVPDLKPDKAILINVDPANTPNIAPPNNSIFLFIAIFNT